MMNLAWAGRRATKGVQMCAAVGENAAAKTTAFAIRFQRGGGASEASQLGHDVFILGRHATERQIS